MARQASATKGIATIRLGLYDPDPEDGRRIYVGRKCRDTMDNRNLFREVIRRYNNEAAQRNELRLCLSMFVEGSGNESAGTGPAEG